MLTQETIIRSEIDLPMKDTQSLKDQLLDALSKIHRIPDGHIASLDVARFIASFFIVIGHAGPFYNSVNYDGNTFIAPFVYAFFNIRRLGLP